RVSLAVWGRRKKGVTPGWAARARRRSARAAPRRSDAHASTPASTTAVAAVRISVRESGGAAGGGGAAVRAGSGAVVSGSPAEGDTVRGRYAAPVRPSWDFPRGKSLLPLTWLHD